MSTQDTTLPSLIYARLDPGVDPPSTAFALDLERQLADGDVALFVDGERPGGGSFDLRR